MKRIHWILVIIAVGLLAETAWLVHLSWKFRHQQLDPQNLLAAIEAYYRDHAPKHTNEVMHFELADLVKDGYVGRADVSAFEGLQVTVATPPASDGQGIQEISMKVVWPGGDEVSFELGAAE